MARDNDAPKTIPVGTHSLPVSASFVADYEQAIDPIVMAERVWIDRKGEDLILHVGRHFVVEGAQHRSRHGASAT